MRTTRGPRIDDAISRGETSSRSTPAARRTAGDAIAQLLEGLPQAFAEIAYPGDRPDAVSEIRVLDVNAAFEDLFAVPRRDLLAAGRGSELPPMLTACLRHLSSRCEATCEIDIDGRTLRVHARPNHEDPRRLFLLIEERPENRVPHPDPALLDPGSAQRSRVADERFRTMADAAPVLLWETDANGIVFVNGHHLDFFGVSLDRVRAMGWAAFLHPDDAQAYLAVYRDAFARRVPYTAEARFRRSDGAYRWLRSTGRPLAGDRFVGCSIDIDDMQRAQRTLRESERRYRALADAANQVLYRHSPDWSHMNQLTGGGFLADTERPDRDWFDAYIHPDDQPYVRDAIQRAIRTKSVFELEHRVRRADGSLGWTLSRSVPVLDEQGDIVEWFGAAADVTARRQAEEDLRESKERLATLVAEMQHRTRNLMGVVRAMADKTMRASTDLEDFEGHFRDRLGALARVQGLLSRIADQERISFDELLRAELTAHGVLGTGDPRVELDGPEHVGLRSRSVQTLALALHELATNAIKYGGLASPEGRLEIRWSRTRSADGRSMLHVDWRERGVRMPALETMRRGQGTELIERALPYQLQAQTHYAFTPDGIHCTMTLPIPPQRPDEDA